MAIRGLRVEKGYGCLLAFARAEERWDGMAPRCWCFSLVMQAFYSLDNFQHGTKIHQSRYYAWKTWVSFLGGKWNTVCNANDKNLYTIVTNLRNAIWKCDQYNWSLQILKYVISSDKLSSCVPNVYSKLKPMSRFSWNQMARALSHRQPRQRLAYIGQPSAQFRLIITHL